MIDSHAHINDEIFNNRIEEVVLNAKNAGIKNIVIPGWDIESSKKAIEIANKYEGVYAAIGIHPENVYDAKDGYLDTLRELSKDKKVVCIGEIGMDYHYTKETKDIQKKILIEQLDLAEELNLPVEIHLRDAAGDFMDIIREYIKSHKKRDNIGIMHSYSESKEIMEELVSYGFYISLSGPVTYKNARVQKEVAKAVPLDKLLTETDSPYLPPVPFRGTINEPKNVLYIVKEIASLKGISEDEVIKESETNFNKIFNIS
ncbi:MAG: TatD family hydrolase [Gammaproteobacteria bacterium]|nr:TatD family hydrolase [Gammaproteobacteria bacterium]